MGTSRSNLLEALKQVERRTENSASGWRLMFYIIVLGPLIVILPLLLLRGDYFDPKTSILLIADLGLLFVAIYFGHATRKGITKQLEQHSVFAQLASGELMDDPLVKLTPWPWRGLLPGANDSATLGDVILRVAWNLDWYLDAPSRYWRTSWIYIPVAVAGLSLLLVSSIGASAYWWIQVFDSQLPFWFRHTLNTINKLSPAWITPWHLLFMAIVATPLPFIYYRRQIWTEELVRHLRERLEA